MTWYEFDRWWKHHVGVAFPNVKDWLKNRCSCGGEDWKSHRKDNESCAVNQIKSSWYGVVEKCEFADVMRATNECQANPAFRQLHHEDHPAEIRSLADGYRMARRPSTPTECKPLSEATADELANIKTAMREPMRVLNAVSKMTREREEGGWFQLPIAERKRWNEEFDLATKSVSTACDNTDYATAVIEANRLVHKEFMEEHAH